MFVVLTESLSVGMSIRQLNKFVHSLLEGCSQQLTQRSLVQMHQRPSCNCLIINILNKTGPSPKPSPAELVQDDWTW